MSGNGDAFFLGLVVLGCGLFVYSKVTEKPKETPKAVTVPPPPLLPATPPVRPTGQVYLTTTKSGSVWSLNADSVKGDKRHRIGWVSMDYSKDKTVSSRSGRTLYSVDCETTATRTLSSIEYDKEGAANRTLDGKPEDPPTYYPPESIAGGVVAEMCADKYGP